MKIKEVIYQTLCLFLCFILPLSAEVLEDGEGVKGGLEVKYQNELLSVNAVNFILSEVLNEITKQTGLKISLLGRLDERISVHVENLSLDKALSKIIGNKANYIFYYNQKVSEDGTNLLHLAEVKVYPQEKRLPLFSGSNPQIVQEGSPQSTLLKISEVPGETQRLAETNSKRSEIAKEKIGEELLGALKSSESEVRENAVFALGEIGDHRAIEPLIQSLKDDNPWVRESAAYALARIGDRKAVEPLIKSLSDENPWVRESAVRALGAIGDEKAVEPIMKLLNDEDGDVRESAAEVLKSITGKEYKPSE